MDKKTIKAILDVIKDVSDRPGLYGCGFERQFIYFTDGYVVVRLEMNQYDGLRPIINEGGVWVGAEQLKEDYKSLGARDIQLTFKNDGGENHPAWTETWKTWSNTEPTADPVPIRPETFKKLAPFGDMLMTITENKMGQKLVAFTGKGVMAFACPLKNL